MYILAAALVTYFAALKLEDAKNKGQQQLLEENENAIKNKIKADILAKKKRICAAAIIITMGIWIVLKYGNFIIDNVNGVLNILHLRWQIESLPFVVPLGISFYTFHAVGYLIDIYREKYKAEHNFAKYFTFIAFFPHIIQGPFSRYDLLGKSMFEKHTFSYDRLCAGCSRILWGVFKKAVVADKLAIAITAVLNDYHTYSGLYIIAAIFFHSIRLYADFVGYMDIVSGVSIILGIDLAKNFNQPYFAKTIDEFWRRWHITLGQWFRDYVFYPVSMGKTAQKIGKWARKKWGPKMGKLVPGYLALLFVWTATGLWHGANWTFLIWGYLNMAAILSTMQLTDWYTKIKEKLHINSEGFVWQAFCIARTFVLVCLFRFFFVADSVYMALSMYKHAIFDIHLGVLKNPLGFFIGMRNVEILAAILGTLIIFIVDVLSDTGKWETVKAKCPMLVKNLLYAAMVLSILLIAGGDNDLVGGFIYANF